jgi:hypothetical protein
MTIGDLWAIVEPFRLLPMVPTDVQTQIDTARHAFIYAWFCNGLNTLGEQHAYGALANGLRLRAAAASAIPKRRGLGALLEKACELGWLDRRDFDVPSAPNRLDVLVQMRNHVDHGRPHSEYALS